MKISTLMWKNIESNCRLNHLVIHLNDLVQRIYGVSLTAHGVKDANEKISKIYLEGKCMDQMRKSEMKIAFLRILLLSFFSVSFLAFFLTKKTTTSSTRRMMNYLEKALLIYHLCVINCFVQKFDLSAKMLWENFYLFFTDISKRKSPRAKENDLEVWNEWNGVLFKTCLKIKLHSFILEIENTIFPFFFSFFQPEIIFVRPQSKTKFKLKIPSSSLYSLKESNSPLFKSLYSS